jgi:molecular chaperone GrpE (heat shock protein)
MNKDDLQLYLQQAIDALDDNDVERLFPKNAQPDLYTVVQEIVGMRGEMRKLAQSSLKLQQEVQILLQNQKDIAAQDAKRLAEPVLNANDDAAFQALLAQLIEQDDLMQRTNTHFKELPPVSYWNMKLFQQQFAAWERGYSISDQRWKNLMKSSGLYTTGKIGDVFDPKFHEAIAVKTNNNQGNNVILESETLGYVCGEKIIRLAKVVVNKV